MIPKYRKPVYSLKIWKQWPHMIVNTVMLHPSGIAFFCFSATVYDSTISKINSTHQHNNFTHLFHKRKMKMITSQTFSKDETKYSSQTIAKATNIYIACRKKKKTANRIGSCEITDFRRFIVRLLKIMTNE